MGVDQLMVGGHLLAGAAWAQHGAPDLAVAAALTALTCCRDAARAEDRCLAYAQLATFAFRRQGYRRASLLIQLRILCLRPACHSCDGQ